MTIERPPLNSDLSLDATIIICSRNRCHSLMEVVRAIFTQQGIEKMSFELLVVDDASTDDTAKVVQEWIKESRTPTKYLYEPTVGQAFAMNRGVCAARGKIVIFTDDDVVLDPHWLIGHLDCFRAYSCMGVGGRLLPRFDPEPPGWYNPSFPFPYKYDFGNEDKPIVAPPFGANMAYRHAAFEQHGVFRTDLGSTPDNPAGKGVDSEFGARVTSAGQKIMYAPKALLHHPLDARLITKAFMHRWYNQYGRSEVLRDEEKVVAPRYFGIPRYLFRGLATNCLRRLFALDSAKRYLGEMEVHRILGQMAAERVRAKQKKT